MMEVLKAFLKEADRSPGTYRYRWKSLRNSFPVDSWMHEVLDSHNKENRRNSGNAGAVGCTAAQLAEYGDDFARLLQLHESKQVFMIRNDGGDAGEPSARVKARAEKEGWAIVTTYSFEGARNRLQSHEKEDGGVLDGGKVRAIHKWNRNFPTKKTTNNAIKIDGYVACIMGEKQATC